MCVKSLRKFFYYYFLFFFRKGAVSDLAGKAMGDGIGKAVAAELLTSWKDKLFQSYKQEKKVK